MSEKKDKATTGKPEEQKPEAQTTEQKPESQANTALETAESKIANQAIIDGVVSGVKELLDDFLLKTQPAPENNKHSENTELVFKPKVKQKPNNKKRK